MFLRYSVPKPLSRILSLLFLGFLFLLQTNGSWSQDVTTTLEQRQLQSRALNQKIIESLDPEQEYVNMGCYRMRVEQFINLFGSQDQKGSFGPNAFLGDISLWTDGIVPFTINPAGIEEGTLDANGNTITGREQLIHDAMEAISSAAQIQFVELPWEPEQQNYIEFRDDQNAAFNYSTQLGMYPFPAKQSIVIVSWNLGVIIHEICHALGMIHEQNRSDRDSYVDIIEENLQEGPSVPYQFAIVTTSDNAGTEYDFGSIMHYGHNYFAKSPGLTTIQPLPAYTAFKYQMGQRTGLSDSDKAALANQYGSKPVQSTPGISPGAGSYLGPLAVNLVIPDPNGVIYGGAFYRYTLDGTDPTEDSNPWAVGQAVYLNNSVTFKWRAFHPQRQPSVVGSNVYTITNETPLVSTPSIIPPGGSSSGPQQVSISTTTTGASIYYTTNGTTPNQNSTPYSGIFTLNNSATVKAKAYKAGHTPSDIATAQFTIQQLQLLPPTFYPDPNVEYGGSVGVSIQTSLPLTRVRYTTNGTEPNDTDSNLFEGDPITLFQDTTIKAKIFRDGFTPSDTITANYTVIPSADTPIITPNGGNHSGSVEVSLTLPAKAASSPSEFMYYTTNGADPETFSTRYTTPFTLGIGTHTVKARTIYPGLPPSTIAQAQFTVFNPSPTLQSPVFKPVQGSHANSVQVSLESLTEGAQIRYTIGDNMAPADPTSNTGTVYSGPFNLGMTTNPGDRWFIRAKAFKSPDESAVIQKNYEIFTPLGDINPPVFDPLPVEGEYFYNPVTVNLSATTDPPTTGIQVYRTTNGDEPIVPDPPGVGQTSVNLTGSTYLKAIAYRAFFGSSDVTSASYNFKCATPTITAQTTKGVNHIASVTVVMNSTTTGGTTKIRYEMGGIEPDENSTEYTSPIVLGVGTHIFKARTYRNDFETSDLAVASFIVEETPEAPMITLDPMDMEVDQYTDVTFTASAIGIPTPEYQWRFNGTPLAGETLGELYIPNVQPGHAGQYDFVASNSTSSATSTAATLTVNQVASPTPTDTLPPTETFTPSETPTGTLPTATSTPTPTDTTDGVTNTPTASETPTETVEPMATVAILSASQDNTIYEDSADLSNGIGPIFNAGRNGSNGNFMLRRALIAFDVASTIPAGATINRVTLTLRVSKENSGMNTFSLHPLQADWGEGDSSEDQGMGTTAQTGDATWMHRFYDTDQWTNMGADFDANPSAMASVDETGSYDWGSTTQMVADVQSWLDNPSTNYGWAIVGDESGATTKNVKQFDSKDNPTEANRPMLAVEYLSEQQPTATPTETATPTPTDTMEGVTESPTPVDTASIEDTDTNGDGVINEFDLLNVLKYWKQEVGP